jgi:hypothetical protein
MNPIATRGTRAGTALLTKLGRSYFQNCNPVRTGLTQFDDFQRTGRFLSLRVFHFRCHCRRRAAGSD